MRLFIALGTSFLLLTTDASAMGRRPPPPAGSIAANLRSVTPTDNERCEAPTIYKAPSWLLQTEGRLHPALRAAAKNANPLDDLRLSARAFALRLNRIGAAYADLAVSGRGSYRRFSELHAAEALTEDAIATLLTGDPLLHGIAEPKLRESAAKALDRAYSVAQILPDGRSQDREAFGWIAVSGEDDMPSRPVNVSSATFAQHDLLVPVDGRVVRTRYMIAESLAEPEAPPALGARELPVAGEPKLSPDARVLLFIHGMDSRIEEADGLIRAFRRIARRTGENWTVITMDLPTSGYAEPLDHTTISPLSDLGHPRLIGFNARGRHNVPVLDFLEKFIVSFVDTLDAKVPFKDKIDAVIGGSMGGNFTFRLGRRRDLPWLKNVVSWSPSSIWQGLADGDIFKQLGVAESWKRAGGKPENLVETPDSRAKFFDLAFDGAVRILGITIVPAQPVHWYRPDYPCFESAIEGAKQDRIETYSREFRLWHWRLAVEMLIYSHQTSPDRSTPRFMDNHVNMLLAAGSADDFHFTNTFTAVRTTAERMTATPGRALLIENTGHSIQTERPNFWAAEIARFLNESRR